MVRVIYCWRVEEKNLEKFRNEWSIATNKIHETAPGALGSFMLQDAIDENQIITIAKWDSVESWEAFWGKENPKEMENMQKLGDHISSKAYKEIDDFTR